MSRGALTDNLDFSFTRADSAPGERERRVISGGSRHVLRGFALREAFMGEKEEEKSELRGMLLMVIKNFCCRV